MTSAEPELPFVDIIMCELCFFRVGLSSFITMINRFELILGGALRLFDCYLRSLEFFQQKLILNLNDENT